MKPELTDAQIALMIKAALEFNAILVALCTQYYGKLDEKTTKQFRSDYKRLFEEYRTELHKIFPKEKV